MQHYYALMMVYGNDSVWDVMLILTVAAVVPAAVAVYDEAMIVAVEPIHGLRGRNERNQEQKKEQQMDDIAVGIVGDIVFVAVAEVLQVWSKVDLLHILPAALPLVAVHLPLLGSCFLLQTDQRS